MRDRQRVRGLYQSIYTGNRTAQAIGRKIRIGEVLVGNHVVRLSDKEHKFHLELICSACTRK